MQLYLHSALNDGDLMIYSVRGNTLSLASTVSSRGSVKGL